MRSLKSILLTSLLAASIKWTSAIEDCQKLAICALDNCIPPKIGYPREDRLINNLLESVNFGCVLGPACYQHCEKCPNCLYAQEQVKRLLLHEETDGKCSKLEQCARSCLDDKVGDPFACVFKSRCAHHCLNKDGCGPCHDIVKRVFTGFCFRNNFIDHYGKKCRPLFDDLAKELVESRQ